MNSEKVLPSRQIVDVERLKKLADLFTHSRD